MNLSSISPDTSAWQLLQSAQNSPANQNSLAALLSATSADGDSSSVSNPGQLFSQLEQLSKTNPTEFKKITSQIAAQLKTAASNTTDSSEANLLNQLATNFATASQSGKFSDLFPQRSEGSSLSSSGATASQPYGASSTQSAAGEILSGIFSAALTQIRSDLNGGSATTSSS